MLEEMERDERIFLMGEEVGHYQGAYKVSEGLLDKFGERRVIDTPIAEAGFAGVGIGAAMAGLRPIIEFMTWNFSFVAFDQIISNAAKVHQMSAGAIHVPIVFRGPNGAAKQVASQHSHSSAPFYTHIPGLYVIQPSTPRDAKGLLKSAIRSNNPVIFLEGETLYGVKGEVPDEGVEELIPIGQSRSGQAGDRLHDRDLGPPLLHGSRSRREARSRRHRVRSHRSAHPSAARHRADGAEREEDQSLLSWSTNTGLMEVRAPKSSTGSSARHSITSMRRSSV